MESEAFDHLDAPMERITGLQRTPLYAKHDLNDEFNNLPSLFYLHTGADVPMPYAVPLEKLALPQLDDILTVVKRVVNRKL